MPAQHVAGCRSAVSPASRSPFALSSACRMNPRQTTLTMGTSADAASGLRALKVYVHLTSVVLPGPSVNHHCPPASTVSGPRKLLN
jgi:hypothetical protein